MESYFVEMFGCESLHTHVSSIELNDRFCRDGNYRLLSLSKHSPWYGFRSHRTTICSLLASAALDFRQWLGGEQKINDYCRSLALAGGKLLSQVLGTPLMDPAGEFTLNMTNVELPLGPNIPDNAVTQELLLRNLLEGWRVSAAIFRHNDRWWARVSAQVWNEVNPQHAS